MLLNQATFLPMIGLVVAGAITRHFQYLSKENIPSLVDFVLNVSLPIVLLHNTWQMQLAHYMSFLPVMLCYSIITILFFLGTFLTLKHVQFSNNESASIASIAVFPNLSLFSIPVILSMPNHQINLQLIAFGVMVCTILFCTLVMPIYLIDRSSSSSKKIANVISRSILSPMMIAIIMGIFLSFSGIKPSDSVTQLMTKFEDALACNGLFLLGMCINIRLLVTTTPQIWFACTIKCLVMPALSFLAASWLAFNSTQIGFLMISTACPSAWIATMFAQKYSIVKEDAIQIMIITTVIAILTYDYWINFGKLSFA